LKGLEEEFELLKMQAKAFALSRRMADIGFIRDITKLGVKVMIFMHLSLNLNTFWGGDQINLFKTLIKDL
jgi:hypothetical protein